MALSRAERHLHLSWAQRARPRQPHVVAHEEPVPHRGRAGGRRRPARADRRRERTRRRRRPGARSRPSSRASSRSTTARSTTALVSWRRELARANAVPAYVIFDNKTLRDVASARPRSPEALLALSGHRAGEARALRRGAARGRGRAFRLTPTGRGAHDAEAGPLGEQSGDGMQDGMHMRSTFPLFPTDDGWPYPDVDADDRLLRQGFTVDDDVDLDALRARREPPRVRRADRDRARRARPSLLARASR